MSWDALVTFAIIGGASFYLVRKFTGSRSKGGGCGCSSGTGCCGGGSHDSASGCQGSGQRRDEQDVRF